MLFCVTLSEGLLNIPSHAHEWVLRCVSRCRASGVRVDRGGDRPADGVAGGRALRAGTLSLQHIEDIWLLFIISELTNATLLALLTEKPMLLR